MRMGWKRDFKWNYSIKKAGDKKREKGDTGKREGGRRENEVQCIDGGNKRRVHRS